jgi:hypothetical protein
MLSSIVNTLKGNGLPGIDQCEEIQIESRRKDILFLGPKYWSFILSFLWMHETASQFVDPYSLIPDPDPSFFVIQDPDLDPCFLSLKD